MVFLWMYPVLALTAVTASVHHPYNLFLAAGFEQPRLQAGTDAKASGLTVRQEDGRLVVTIDDDLLTGDFLLRASDARMPGVDLRPSAPLASGALQLQRTGDSLLLLEYTGMVRGRLQYRRRDAMQILRRTTTGAIVVDAGPLWASVVRGSTVAPAWEPWHAGGPEPKVSQAVVEIHPRHLPVAVGARLNILRLPKQPMRPRLYDPRVPFLAAGNFIYRWRLEKRDPASKVSDVVEPIVFRLSETFPQTWVPHIKQSILKWNSLFEAIGYRDAILVRLAADMPKSDRELLLNWTAVLGGDGGAQQQGGNAEPTVDPRTGEVLGGRIILNREILPRIGRNAVIRGELDPLTPLPLPDSLQLLLVEYLILHEVGHTLGLEHNFKGGGVYPTDSLRRLTFVHRMGSSASVMAYADGNHVAQPEDGLTFLDRRTRIGPYDRWALDWGYRPIPDANTPEAEKPTLDRWRVAQDTALYLRTTFGVELDPMSQPFTSGGDDPIKSAEYGLRNLIRLVAALDPRRDTALEVHPRPFYIANAWKTRLTAVANVVGGATAQPPYPADLAKIKLSLIDSAQQVQALKFLLAHMFYGEDELVTKYVLGAPLRRPPSLMLFDSVTDGWNKDQWREFQKDGLTQLGNRLILASKVLSEHVGLRTALCQELTGLKERLAAASNVAGPSSGHVKELQYIFEMYVFGYGGGCQ